MNPTLPPIVPQTTDGMDQEPSTWPTWFGVIAIVLGALLALGGCCGLAMPQLTALGGRMANLELPEMPAAMKWLMLGDALVSAVLAVLLVAGGIKLVRRRAGGRPLLMAYAGTRLALALPLLLGGYLMLGPTAEWNAAFARSQVDMMERSNAGAKVPPALREAAANDQPTAFNYAMFFAMAPLGLVFPAAIVIKLGSARVKAEVARWDR